MSEEITLTTEQMIVFLRKAMGETMMLNLISNRLEDLVGRIKELEGRLEVLGIGTESLSEVVGEVVKWKDEAKR